MKLSPCFMGICWKELLQLSFTDSHIYRWLWLFFKELYIKGTFFYDRINKKAFSFPARKKDLEDLEYSNFP